VLGGHAGLVHFHKTDLDFWLPPIGDTNCLTDANDGPQAPFLGSFAPPHRRQPESSQATAESQG
jgi:hypothetical protein